MSAEDGSCLIKSAGDSDFPGLIPCDAETPECQGIPIEEIQLLIDLGYTDCQYIDGGAYEEDRNDVITFGFIIEHYSCENTQGNIAMGYPNQVSNSYVTGIYEIVVDGYLYSAPTEADYERLHTALQLAGYIVEPTSNP